jgi:hypothetical protein
MTLLDHAWLGCSDSSVVAILPQTQYQTVLAAYQALAGFDNTAGGLYRGQSGNPGGRPKVMPEIRELARNHGPEAIKRLVALMHSKNQSVAVRAAEALLDRGYGRPMQGLEISEREAPPKHTVIRVTFVTPPKRDEHIPSHRALPSSVTQKESDRVVAPLPFWPLSSHGTRSSSGRFMRCHNTMPSPTAALIIIKAFVKRKTTSWINQL